MSCRSLNSRHSRRPLATSNNFSRCTGVNGAGSSAHHPLEPIRVAPGNGWKGHDETPAEVMPPGAGTANNLCAAEASTPAQIGKRPPCRPRRDRRPWITLRFSSPGYPRRPAPPDGGHFARARVPSWWEKPIEISYWKFPPTHAGFAKPPAVLDAARPSAFESARRVSPVTVGAAHGANLGGTPHLAVMALTARC